MLIKMFLLLMEQTKILIKLKIVKLSYLTKLLNSKPNINLKKENIQLLFILKNI